MKCCIQRVKYCSVTIDGKVFSSINEGLLVLLGIEEGDENSSCDWLSNKVCNLRVFSDSDGKMSLDLKDISGEICVVSQFTLAGNIKKGRRPDFSTAMAPDVAAPMVDYFIDCCRMQLGKDKVKTGVFAADMKVELLNDGPVTLILEHPLK